MKRLVLLGLLWPILSYSQGIQWSAGLSWEQVKQRAKAENKYIFLDCYTTWCGPCKVMENEVYINDSVGDFFNKRFLSVKVQLDKTGKDNDEIKKWYDNAALIGKQFKIEAFPCCIFLSPAGQIIHKAEGYTGVTKFMEIGQLALKPGQLYNDPYAEYDLLVADYTNGVMHYDRMLYMIKSAQKFDPFIVPQLTKLYSEYIDKLDADKRFTEDVIEFWSMNVFNSISKGFRVFYKQQEKVDAVMNKKGFAAEVIDKAIYNELVVPFFSEQNKNPNIPITGMYLNGIKPDSGEADWQKLEKLIRKKFNKEIAKRNMVSSRIEWYIRHWNNESACRYKLIEFKHYPPDLNKQSVVVNQFAWNAFKYVANKKILNEYIKWMMKVVDIKMYPNYLDTYANLLYKSGKKEDAIRWEEKAVEIGVKWGNNVDGFKVVIEKMKRGEYTYGVKFL